MTINLSNQILLLSDNNRISLSLKKVLSENNLEVNSDYINLTSLSLIRKIIKNTQNTSFIRTEYLKFIQQKGYPFFIAIDYKIDSGLPNELDPDQLKILKTFLISISILAKGKGFENIKGNILLLTKNENNAIAQEYEKNPHFIMNIIKTKDPVVNKLLEQLKSNRNEFNKLFFIKTTNFEKNSNDFTFDIKNYIDAIKARENLRKPVNTSPKMSSENNPPASIIYKLNEDKIFIDSILNEDEKNDENFSLLKNKQIYIKGYWTNKTQLEVSEKLLQFIKTGPEKDNKFDKEENINIILDNNTKLDASTAPSLVQLLARDLINYKISVKTSNENNEILQKSEGYKLIQKQIKLL